MSPRVWLNPAILLIIVGLLWSCASSSDRPALPQAPMGMGQIQITRVTNDSERESRLRASPEGNRLLFNLGSTANPGGSWLDRLLGNASDIRTTYRQVAIAMIDLRSGPGKSIVSQENAIDPTWFPDNRGFAFSMLQGGQAMLARSAIGGETAAIQFVAPTPCVEYDREPSISPNGDRVLFSTLRPGESYNIAVMGIRTTTEKCKILFPGDYPQWNPRGGAFTFTRVVNGFDQIFVFDEDENLLTQITFGDFNNRQPAWSPEGNRVVFSTDRNGDPDIYTVGRDGTGLVQVTQGPTTDEWPTWAADGSIYFVSDADGKYDIWRAQSIL